jgi:hypothetical protein
MQLILKFLATLSIATLFTSCGIFSGVDRRPASASLAKEVLTHPKITLLRKQVSGRVDRASSYQNIASQARGYQASRSNYGRAPGGYTKLRRKMLKTMLYLADKKATHIGSLRLQADHTANTPDTTQGSPLTWI